MTREPDWTEDEFDILMHAGRIPAEDLVAQLPRRSVGAINAVRGGVHHYHTAGGTSLLSAMQRRYLADRHGALACPHCGERV